MSTIDWRVRQGGALLNGLLLTATIAAAVQTPVPSANLEQERGLSHRPGSRSSRQRLAGCACGSPDVAAQPAR